MITLEHAKTLAQDRNYPEAENILKSLIRENPQNREGRLLLGTVLTNAGKFDEAIAELCILLSENPQDAEALVMMDYIKCQHKDVDDEIPGNAFLKEAVQNGEDLPAEISPLYDLEQIEKNAVSELLKYMLTLTEYLPAAEQKKFTESKERSSLVRLIDNLNACPQN